MLKLFKQIFTITFRIKFLIFLNSKKEFYLFMTVTTKWKPNAMKLSQPNILIHLFNIFYFFALFLLYYPFIIPSNISIKLYSPFPMAYGVCCEEKHVYELQDRKKN